MKELSAIALALLLVAPATAARSAAKWSAGVKGGVNLGDLAGEDAPDETSLRTGFMGGAFVQVDLSEEAGLRVEGLWVQKGAEFADSLFILPVEGTVEIEYIELPVLFVVNLSAGGKGAFEIFAGPTFAFNTSASAEGNGRSVDLNGNNFEFGVAFGAGVEYAWPTVSIVIDGRYSLGATSIIEDDEATSGSVDLLNRGIGIMAGLAFPLTGVEPQ
jgi:hypothetical protein